MTNKPSKYFSERCSLSIVLLLATLSASGCGKSDAEREAERKAQQQRDAIRRVLSLDKAYSKIRQQGIASHDADKILAAIHQYTDALMATDMTDLPSDVREAYARHNRAWQDTAALLDQYSGITGSLFRSFDSDKFNSRLATAQKALEDTWADVKAKANAHGVDTSAD